MSGTAWITELLVAGQLPPAQLTWVTHYANEIAKGIGPVALVRLGDNDTALTLLDPTGSKTPGQTTSTFAGAIARFLATVKCWIIYPARIITVDELLTAGADRITIITSHDDVGVAVADGILNSLATAANRSDQHLPRLALALLGPPQTIDARNHAIKILPRTEIHRLGSHLNVPGEITVNQCLSAAAVLDVIDKARRDADEAAVRSKLIAENAGGLQIIPWEGNKVVLARDSDGQIHVLGFEKDAAEIIRIVHDLAKRIDEIREASPGPIVFNGDFVCHFFTDQRTILRPMSDDDRSAQ